MRTPIFLTCILLVACGHARKPVAPTIAFDPELLEVCLVEQTQASEASCVRQVDDLGRVTWKYPMGKTSDFERFTQVMGKPGGNEAGISLASNLIRKPGHYVCHGSEKACEKLRSEVACEAEVARFTRIGLLIEVGRPKEAFLDVAEIVRIGPTHYRYDDVPEVLERLRSSLPAGVVETCITQFDYQAYGVEGKSGDPHYKPYTKDNPAPNW